MSFQIVSEVFKRQINLVSHCYIRFDNRNLRQLKRDCVLVCLSLYYLPYTTNGYGVKHDRSFVSKQAHTLSPTYNGVITLCFSAENTGNRISRTLAKYLC